MSKKKKINKKNNSKNKVKNNTAINNKSTQLERTTMPNNSAKEVQDKIANPAKNNKDINKVNNKDINKVNKKDIDTKSSNENKSNKSKIKSFMDKYGLYIISSIGIGALVLVSIKICSNHLNHTIQNNNINIEESNTTTTISNIGTILNNKKIVNTSTMYTIDPSYDYRFEKFKDSIIDSYLLTSSSTDNLEEIFVIKSTDINLVYSELEKYKDSLLTIQNEHNLNALENLKINKVNDIAYLIVSKNSKKIEEIVLKEISR